MLMAQFQKGVSDPQSEDISPTKPSGSPVKGVFQAAMKKRVSKRRGRPRGVIKRL